MRRCREHRRKERIDRREEKLNNKDAKTRRIGGVEQGQKDTGRKIIAFAEEQTERTEEKRRGGRGRAE